MCQKLSNYGLIAVCASHKSSQEVGVPEQMVKLAVKFLIPFLLLPFHSGTGLPPHSHSWHVPEVNGKAFSIFTLEYNLD